MQMAVIPSPAVARVAALLRTMGAAPARELPLAELARRSGVSKPTAHSLLLGLVAEGLVERVGPVPAYRLGPALVELGDLARREPTLLDAVAPEVARLRETLGASAMGAAVEDDEVVVLAAQCVPHPFGYEIVAGTRLALHAPIGPVYVAWSGDDAERRWLDAAPSLNDARRNALARDLAAVRRRGWSATVRTRKAGDTRFGPMHEIATTDLTAADITVVGISAPVRASSGAVVGCVALVGFVDPMPGSRVVEYAAEVVDAATRATARFAHVHI
jgi:DNA-binding IclR family transcriptional regulator